MTEVPADLLRQYVERQHGVKASLNSTAHVIERQNGQIIWDGIVHIFDIEGDSRWTRAYAWSRLIDAATGARRFYAMPQEDTMESPADAVRAVLAIESQAS